MSDIHIHENTNEKKTLIVIFITILTMLTEIIYGYLTNSMALLADGYHMGTHALAFCLTYAAYILIRKFRDSSLFPNGTEKIGHLAAYTSAIFLGLTGFWIIYEAAERFFNPLKIQFKEAILVAIVGLVVNIVSIFVMEFKNKHAHDDACHDTKDYNFMAAYYHILADAVTSVFAILALVLGKYLNITSLDAFAGILGGFLIIKWSAELIKKTVRILVDMED